MKKVLFLLITPLIFIVIFILFLGADEPKPVVAVLMLENMKQDTRLDAICHTVKDTIALTLKLMAKYRVIEDDTVLGYEDLEAVRRYAADNNIDNIMFGRLMKLRSWLKYQFMTTMRIGLQSVNKRQWTISLRSLTPQMN